MPPTWLTVLAWISLASAFVCAGLIAVDIFVRGYRQHAWITDVLWPLTALAGLRRVLVSDAGGDNSRFSDRVSGEQLADQARDQGGNVSAAPLEVLARPVPSRGGIPTSARAAA
jgi:hypothetical protein